MKAPTLVLLRRPFGWGQRAAHTLRAGLLLASLSALPRTAPAQTAALSFSGGTTGIVGPGTILGYSFDVTSSVTVSGLSIFDFSANGLVDSHEVGLWDLFGTLLASITIPSGTAAPLDGSGQFRFMTLPAPVILPVATGYTVAALFGDGGDELNIMVTGLTTAPGVTFVTSRVNIVPVPVLERPISTFPVVNPGYFGGSFVVASNTVPEPSTYALMGVGLAALAVVARRRRV